MICIYTFQKKSTTSFGCVVLLGILVFYSTNLSVSSFLSLSVSSLTSTHKSSHTQLSKERLFGNKKSKKITIHFTLQQKHISLSLSLQNIYTDTRKVKSVSSYNITSKIQNSSGKWHGTHTWRTKSRKRSRRAIQRNILKLHGWLALVSFSLLLQLNKQPAKHQRTRSTIILPSWFGASKSGFFFSCVCVCAPSKTQS